MSNNPIRNPVSSYGAIDSNPEVGFSNNNPEITAICDSVSTNIYTINGCAKNLRDALQAIGTARDSQGFRDEIHVWQLSTNQVVKEVQTYFGKLSVLSRTANKQQKLQIDKLTSHFKDAVNAYGKSQKEVASKLKLNLLRSHSMEQSDNDTSLLIEEEEENVRKLRQEHRNLEFEQEMFLDRERRVQKIEEDVLDVNQIMKDLAGLVHEQGYLVDSIENNVETVHQNVEQGSQQLEQAARYQAKSRNKKICLAATAVIILTGLILYIVISLR